MKWKVKIGGCFGTRFIFDKFADVSDFAKTALESCMRKDERVVEIELMEEEEYEEEIELIKEDEDGRDEISPR